MNGLLIQVTPADNLAFGQTRTIEVTYEVKDAEDATDTNSFIITVNGTNDDPVATFTTPQTTTEDSAVVTGQLTATDIDDGDVLKYFSVTPVDGLTIVEATASGPLSNSRELLVFE